jgi:beta-phosphoglucomutase-like phosphatase (HAD superfamily)
MTSWMKRLSDHYERMRRRYPDEDLMILFDIDGTILDSRYMILHALQSYDRAHGTERFRALAVKDITVNESQVELLLESMEIGGALRDEVLAWYAERCWTPEGILRSHRPFAGVMEVIRWFQIQPRTHVGLNTGRPESIRRETLLSLNNIGREYKVNFRDEHLFMNRRGWGDGVVEEKVEGIRRFRAGGFRVIAFVDNEPENLRAVAEMDARDEVLLLHAHTIFRSKRGQLPVRSVAGRDYDITELVPERALPRHVQFVWHGVNDEANLRQFLASNVEWAECDLRFDPDGEGVVLRNDSFEETAPDPDEPLVGLGKILERLRGSDKSLKLDLKENGSLLDRVVGILKDCGVPDRRLWFNGMVEVLREEGFRKLAGAFPGAIVQCPIDFLVPLILGAPPKALAVLDVLQGWGINRFSVNWKAADKQEILDKLERWGYELNIYNVPDLEAFLKAVLLLPRSVTSDFNFPKWNYFGRGPGIRQRHFEYTIIRAPELPAL